MVDRVVADRVTTADRARERGIGPHELSREKERAGHVLSAQHGEDSARAVSVRSAVEGQRYDALARLEPDELAGDDRGW
jgi:hypothetical protein